MAVVGVSEAARALAVSPQRVRAMLAAGKLDGRKLEGVWLVNLPLQNDTRLRPRRRPMSAAQAWRSLALLSSQDIQAPASAESHLRKRLRNALVQGAADPVVLAGLLRAWMPRRAETLHYFAPEVPFSRLRNEAALLPSGGSHPDSPVRDLQLFEAYAAQSELKGIVQRNSLIPMANGNAVLRVVSEPEGLRWISSGELPMAAVAADLAEHDEPRSIAAAGQMIAGVVL